MIEKIAAGIAEGWIKKKMINTFDKEIYEYGIILTFEYMASLFTTVLIAFLTQEIPVCIVFYISFATLRSYAGGIHAKNFFRCYIYSTLIILMYLLMIRFNIFDILLYRIVYAFSFVYLLKSQPIDSENKRVDDEEKKIFGMRKRKILIIMSALVLLCIGFDFGDLEKALESAVITVFLCCVLCKGNT